LRFVVPELGVQLLIQFDVCSGAGQPGMLFCR